jgi:phospholipid-binding lipoprotein MlaA
VNFYLVFAVYTITIEAHFRLLKIMEEATWMNTGKYLQVVFLFFLVFTLYGFPAVNDSFFGNRVLAADSFVAIENEEPAGGPVVVHDPYQGFNRAMFSFNDKMYFWVLKPVDTVYAAYFPPGFRAAVRNGFHNMLFPSRFVNCALQGKMDKAGSETVRFLINSTIGLGGLFDVAEKEFSIHNYEEDFGLTLAHFGAGSGPFLMVPLVGPSNPRDLFGYAVDSGMDPMYYIPAAIWVSPTVKAGKVVNNTSLSMSEYEDWKKAALDPYISMRDAYVQHREKEIKK